MLEAINNYRAENPYMPSVRDLMKIMKIRSPNGVVVHLKALEKKGYIKVHRNIARGIEVIE